MSLPVSDPWLADASFAQHPLLAVHWGVKRAVPAGIEFVKLDHFQRSPVVAHEEDEGVVFESVLAEAFHYLSDSVVDGRHHREAFAAALRHRGGKAVEIFLRGVRGNVGGPVRKVEEKRPILVPLDECAGSITIGIEMVNRAIDLSAGDGFAVEIEIGPCLSALSLVAIHVVEAVGDDLVGRPEMPFAGHAGGVACLF